MKKQKWDKKAKKTIKIDVPDCIKIYNQGMGGVDLFDQQMAYNRILIKSAKWSQRLVNHFIEAVVNNSYLEHKMDSKAMGFDEKKVMSRNVFFKKIAEGLLQPAPKKRGRPSKESVEVEAAAPLPKRKSVETRPLQEVRTDQYGHFPIFKEKGRCKNEDCTSTTTIMCCKCNVHFCLVPNRNCFFKAHNG